MLAKISGIVAACLLHSSTAEAAVEPFTAEDALLTGSSFALDSEQYALSEFDDFGLQVVFAVNCVDNRETKLTADSEALATIFVGMTNVLIFEQGLRSESKEKADMFGSGVDTGMDILFAARSERIGCEIAKQFAPAFFEE